MPRSQRLSPNVYGYHDYRAYLKDWIQTKRKTKRGYSLRRLAQDCELAVGLLSMVINGKRTLTPAALSKMGAALDLDEQERHYLELLRDLSDSETPEARTDALERLQKLSKFRNNHTKEFEVYRYMARWTYVAIRELAGLKGFQTDPVWIQNQLRYKVSLAEIREALEFLIENGFLKRTPSGAIEPPVKSLDCSGGVYRVALHKFHREMLGLAGKSLEEVESEDRHIVGQTIALPAGKMDRVKEILEEACQKIRDLSGKPGTGEELVHVELAAFPLTEKKVSKKI